MSGEIVEVVTDDDATIDVFEFEFESEQVS